MQCDVLRLFEGTWRCPNHAEVIRWAVTIGGPNPIEPGCVSVGGAMIEFDVLGTLRIRRAGESVRLDAVMVRRLLVVLLARTGSPVSLDVLVESLWSGAPPRSARKTTQNYVHRLRAALGGGQLIACEPSGYRLVVSREALDSARVRGAGGAGPAGARRW